MESLPISTPVINQSANQVFNQTLRKKKKGCDVCGSRQVSFLEDTRQPANDDLPIYIIVQSLVLIKYGGFMASHDTLACNPRCAASFHLYKEKILEYCFSSHQLNFFFYRNQAKKIKKHKLS